MATDPQAESPNHLLGAAATTSLRWMARLLANDHQRQRFRASNADALLLLNATDSQAESPSWHSDHFASVANAKDRALNTRYSEHNSPGTVTLTVTFATNKKSTSRLTPAISATACPEFEFPILI